MNQERREEILNAVEAINTANVFGFSADLNNLVAFLNGSLKGTLKEIFKEYISYGSCPKIGRILLSFQLRSLLKSGDLSYSDGHYSLQNQEHNSATAHTDRVSSPLDREKASESHLKWAVPNDNKSDLPPSSVGPSEFNPSNPAGEEKNFITSGSDGNAGINESPLEIKDGLIEELRQAITSINASVSEADTGTGYSFELKDGDSARTLAIVNATKEREGDFLVFVRKGRGQKSEYTKFALQHENIDAIAACIRRYAIQSDDDLKSRNENSSGENNRSSSGQEKLSSLNPKNYGSAENKQAKENEALKFDSFVSKNTHISINRHGVPDEVLGSIAEHSVFNYGDDFVVVPESSRNIFETKRNFLCLLMKWKIIAWTIDSASGLLSEALIVDRRNKRYWIGISIKNRSVLFYSEMPVSVLGISGPDLIRIVFGCN